MENKFATDIENSKLVEIFEEEPIDGWLDADLVHVRSKRPNYGKCTSFLNHRHVLASIKSYHGWNRGLDFILNVKGESQCYSHNPTLQHQKSSFKNQLVTGEI